MKIGVYEKYERVGDRMKRLSVHIDEEEYQALKELAEDRNVTVSDVLANYIRDLTGVNSNGSDERMYARQYFDRSWVSWMNLRD